MVVIGLKDMINSLRQQDGSSESLHPLRSDKLAYLPSEFIVFFHYHVAINYSSREALVPSLKPDLLIDFLMRGAS